MFRSSVIVAVSAIPLLVSPAIAQVQSDRKVEADRLLVEAIQLLQTDGFSAIDLFERALTIYQDIDDRPGELQASFWLGGLYLQLGSYPQAQTHYQQTLELARELDDRRSELLALSGLGNIQSSLGKYENAIDYFQKAFAIDLGDENIFHRGNLFNSLGLAYQNLGDYDRAIANYQEAVVWHERSSHFYADRQGIDLNTGTLYSLVLLGNAYRELQQYDRAIESHQQAVNISETSDISSLEQNLVILQLYPTELALSYALAGDRDRAITLAERTQNELNRDFRASENILRGQYLAKLSRVWAIVGDRSRSEQLLREAIDILERSRSQLGSRDALKIDFAETIAASYQQLQQILIEDDRPEEALEIAERSRARAFVELIASRLFLEAEDYDRAERTYFDPPSIQQIRAIAAEQNATLVEYAIGDSQLFVWVVDPDGEIEFRAVDLEDSSIADTAIDASLGAQTGRGAIAQIARGTRTTIIVDTTATDDSFSGIRRLQESYQLLIEPIADLLPSDPEAHVIFIPQGELFLVPFAALQDENEQFFIEKHTFRVAPSIQTLSLTRQQRERLTTQGDRLVVGYPRQATVVGNPVMPSVPGSPDPLEPLPGAELEALAIAELLDTEPLIGAEATKAAVLSRLSRADLVHLATHGLLDDLGTGIPGALALAPTSDDSGLLSAAEILPLQLNAHLVVLSACDSGRGRITGDGVVGLSRSFVGAGVPSVVVSLWQVPDAPTAELMVQFYQQLQDNPDKARALRQAMLATMVEYPLPRDWAAFVLVGEGE